VIVAPVELVTIDGPGAGIRSVAEFERWRVRNLEAKTLELSWDDFAALSDDAARQEASDYPGRRAFESAVRAGHP